MSIEEGTYNDKQIGNSDFKGRRSFRTKKPRVDLSDLLKAKLQKFSFPGLGVTIEAESLEEAVKKLEAYKKK